MTAGPDLSVVVPAVNDITMLSDTLTALTSQAGEVVVEILVPHRTGEASRETVQERFPEARVLTLPADTTIPAMRRHAFAAASAPAVAVIEDHVTVPPDWATRMLEGVSASTPVVGGWVHNEATDRLVDRAAFLCEYGHMLRPLPSGPVSWVTGNNVVYHRSVLERFQSVIDEERWENHLHDAVRDSGSPLTLRAEASVGHKMHYASAWEYAGQRFLYSRAYAGLRLAGKARGATVVHGLGAFLLPPLLLLRIVKNGWGASGSRVDLLKSLPLLTLFVSAWALGEVVGALAGPGDALAKVR